jgi:hypothetical protein
VDEPQQEMRIMQRSRDDINCRCVAPSCGPRRLPHGTRC